MTSSGRRLTSTDTQLPLIEEEEDTAESVRRDIDETLRLDATRPRRNAFAEEGLRLHRHRLASNAFYQEQFSKRKLTPPTVLHPALRYNTDLYNIAEPLPELKSYMINNRPSLEMEQVSPRVSPLRPREDRNTTMTNFIDDVHFGEHASSPPLRSASSPPLWLAPSPNATHVATLRNDIEERAAAVSDETITVTRPSPKKAGRDSGHHSRQFEYRSANGSPASPKKSLLDRFRVSSRRGAVPLQPLPPITMTGDSHNMPAKARAVLVTAPPFGTVVRSPSKTKGLWFRRKPSASEEIGHASQGPVLKEPPRDAHPIYSKSARSHSLGYMENSVPPTPPMKDTPPEEKARQDAISAGVISVQDGTPCRKTGSVSLTNRTNPTNFAKLVKQPSTRSFRASIVPDAMHGRDFIDAEERIDGLGLAGFSLSEEIRRNSEQYSPSVYSPDFSNDSRATFPPVATHQHKKSKSTSDNSTTEIVGYPMIYPDLVRNHSLRATFATPPNKNIYEFCDINSTTSYVHDSRQDPSPTIRQDGIDVVIHKVDDMLRDGQPSPSTSSLFAIPVGHASAQVSPLHIQPAVFSQSEYQRTSSDGRPILRNSKGEEILPATIYIPRNVQKKLNNSPGHERHSKEDTSPHVTDKKSTCVMPGLQYDSSVDVDPKKANDVDVKLSRHSRTSSKPWSTAPRSDKRMTQTDPQTGSPNVAGFNAADIMRRCGAAENRVKELVESYRQAEVTKRLHDLEESSKQEALARSISDKEERRGREQEVMFDHRIASLEIERFSREPSPSDCHETSEMAHPQGSQRWSLSPSQSLRDRKSARQHRRQSPALSPDEVDERPDAKRISTDEAKEFYECQLRDSPIPNPGNIDTSSRDSRGQESSSFSISVRGQAPENVSHAPTSLQDSEKILQLQEKVARQEEWMQEAMLRMAAMEARYEENNRDRR